MVPGFIGLHSCCRHPDSAVVPGGGAPQQPAGLAGVRRLAGDDRSASLPDDDSSLAGEQRECGPQRGLGDALQIMELADRGEGSTRRERA
ncbi:MAG TPA: hypothetical protein VI365_19210 [Trebonia sp.]